MVFSTVPRSPAICLLSFPATTCVSTSRSRGVNVASLCFDRCNFVVNSSRPSVARLSLRDGLEEILDLHRFGQEIDRAPPSSRAHLVGCLPFPVRNITGLIEPGGCERFLKSKTVKSGMETSNTAQPGIVASWHDKNCCGDV